MTENGPFSEAGEMQEEPKANPLVIEVNAFPSSLKEHPWSRDVEVIVDAGSIARSIQILWPLVECDLDGLGQIMVFPTVLELAFQESTPPIFSSFELSDQEEQRLGTIAPGMAFQQPIFSPHQMSSCLTLKKVSHALPQSVIFPIRVQLHTFHACLSLPSRNLWWLEGGEERRTWQGKTIVYTNPSMLLEDLGGNVERFIAEAGVIGYQERRRKQAALLYNLGRVAQAIEAYPQAIQFYGKSGQKFRSFGDIPSTEKIFLILRDLFLRQGKKEQALHVSSQLLNLRSSK